MAAASPMAYVATGGCRTKYSCSTLHPPRQVVSPPRRSFGYGPPQQPTVSKRVSNVGGGTVARGASAAGRCPGASVGGADPESLPQNPGMGSGVGADLQKG